MARRSPGSALIEAERLRQMGDEGWTPDHDAEHTDFELSAAAECYVAAARHMDGFSRWLNEEGPAWAASYKDDDPEKAEAFLARITEQRADPVGAYYGRNEDGTVKPPDDWPWAASYWKPSVDPFRNLIKAGALIAADLDRLST